MLEPLKNLDQLEKDSVTKTRKSNAANNEVPETEKEVNTEEPNSSELYDEELPPETRVVS